MKERWLVPILLLSSQENKFHQGCYHTVKLVDAIFKSKPSEEASAHGYVQSRTILILGFKG